MDIFVKIAICLALVIILSGCDNECDTVDETECNGTVVQYCNADNRWEDVMDCTQVEPLELNWTCCLDTLEKPYLHACLPASECEVLNE